jgi:calcium-dependent protein kinase
MHWDLKLENLILKNDSDIDNNIVKIVDFGLASKCDVSNYLFWRCGTPGYVAPEIINSSSKETTIFTP